MNKDIEITFRNFIEDGLKNEIFIAEESYFILQTINKHWNKLSKDNYGVFFSSLYSAHFIRYSLALTKLFDKPHRKYQIVSLRTVLDFIKVNLMDEDIQEKYNVAKQFANRTGELVEYHNISNNNLAKTLVTYFEREIPSGNFTGNISLEKVLEIIRIYRDKYYAHKENLDPNNFPKIGFKDSQKLLEFSKFFVSIFGFAYLNTLYSTDGSHYILTSDAQMTNNAFLRLLDKCGFDIDRSKKI